MSRIASAISAIKTATTTKSPAFTEHPLTDYAAFAMLRRSTYTK